MKRVMLLILAVVMLAAATGAAFASDIQSPPVATHMESGPELVSFRVWVLPALIDGVQVDGHYEYFQMMMDLGNSKEVIDGLEQYPSLQAVPVETGRVPALQ